MIDDWFCWQMYIFVCEFFLLNADKLYLEDILQLFYPEKNKLQNKSFMKTL